MTKANIYNFQVGDVFQVKDYNSNPGYGLTLDTITEKIVGTDTIWYVRHRTFGYYGPPPLPTFQTEIDTLIIFDLNGLAEHYFYWSCLPIINDTTSSVCSDTIFARHSNQDDTCFEPPMWDSYLYPGLGGPYYSLTDYSSMVEYNHDLIYYNTSDLGECGTYELMNIGIEEELLANEKVVLKYFDLNGKEIDLCSNKIIVVLFTDGTREKIFISE